MKHNELALLIFLHQILYSKADARFDSKAQRRSHDAALLQKRASALL
jgi:hypothetical protein